MTLDEQIIDFALSRGVQEFTAKEVETLLHKDPQEVAVSLNRLFKRGKIVRRNAGGRVNPFQYRHIDEEEFAKEPHNTHACQECGHIWRPAIVATIGVKFLPGFKITEGQKE